MPFTPTNMDANGFSQAINRMCPSALTYNPWPTVSIIVVSPKAFDTTDAQGWHGLGSTYEHASASTTARSRFATQFEFPWQDLENELTGPHEQQHELRLIISGHRWVASSNIGTFWHEANDLDDKDIASFALLDTLTRWLPHWRGGILHVRTNDVCALRGIRGAYSHSGVWHAVWSLCEQYDVQLSAKVVEPSLADARGSTRDNKYVGGAVRRALRNPEVVDAAVKWLMVSGEQESTVYRTMLSHLRV